MHPILIQITESFFIGTYGVMIALGLLAAVLVSSWHGRKIGIGSDAVWDMATICILVGFASARVLYLFENFKEFLADPVRLILSREGFVFYGGLIGATGGCLYYVRRNKLNVWAMTDLVAVALPLAHAFGRIGCHFAGCCFGGACSIDAIALRVPMAVRGDGELMPNAFLDQLSRGTITQDAGFSTPIWPVQLMESGLLFALAGTIAWIFWRKPRPAGLAMGCYLVAYGIIRFSVEFLRGDDIRGLYFGASISQGQLISIAAFAIGVVVVGLRRNAAPAPRVEVTAPISR